MISEQPLFNLSMLEEMSDNNFIIQVINLYLQDSHSDINEMRDAFVSGDLDTVYKKAHKVKGSTAMLNATVLCDLLATIERTARVGTYDEKLGLLVVAASEQFGLLKSALLIHVESLQQVA